MEIVIAQKHYISSIFAEYTADPAVKYVSIALLTY